VLNLVASRISMFASLFFLATSQVLLVVKKVNF